MPKIHDIHNWHCGCVTQIQDNERYKITVPSNCRTELHTSIAPIAFLGNLNRTTHLRKFHYAREDLRICNMSGTDSTGYGIPLIWNELQSYQ